MIRIFTLIVALTLSALSFATSRSEQEARDFFARYAALGKAYDPAVADLYSDEAFIRAFRRYPHGLERAMELRGVQWKALVRKAMPLAKAQNDRSEYKEPRFEVTGGKVKISAKRYSVRKCYWDPSYYMVLQKQPNGSLTIVEEYSETQPHADC
jgi:hypothetical protein